MLRAVKEEIYTFEENTGGIFSTQEHKDKISSLMHKETQILKEREESWRLWSREIWLKDWDDNILSWIFQWEEDDQHNMGVKKWVQTDYTNLPRTDSIGSLTFQGNL